MNFTDLITKYDFHDSLITNINIGPNVEITLDFCHWRQDYFTNGMIENDKVLLVCHDAEIETDIYGEIDHFSILNIEADSNQATLFVLDDFNDIVHRVHIISSEVVLNL